jgi:hypothetical protein
VTYDPDLVDHVRLHPAVRRALVALANSHGQDLDISLWPGEDGNPIPAGTVLVRYPDGSPCAAVTPEGETRMIPHA